MEVDEILLNSIGQSEGATWWAEAQCHRGIRTRITYLTIVPPGALLYIRCDDQDEAEFVRSYMVEQGGCHPKTVTVRQVGRLITCRGCGRRRPFWATARGLGQHCRPCWWARTDWSSLTQPEGGQAVSSDVHPGPGRT